MTEEELQQLIEQAARENWTELDVSGNELRVLPPEIGKLHQLKKLFLGKYIEDKDGYTSVIGNPLTALPGEIGQLTNLEELHIVKNRLTGLPVEITQLTNLQTLDLSSNQLSSLPVEITQLTNLQTLDLWNNQLSSLPVEITQLTNLQTLNLGNNQLSSLPVEITQLTNLQTLNLWNNQLSSLPVEITQLTNLQTLNLGNNQLSSLPVEITQLTNLQTLDLWNNQLSSLPVEITQLTNLQTLDLSSNQLSSLPVEITQLTNLQTLDLWNNQLSSLPVEITQLTNLQTLNLGNNQLSSLPVEITQLTNLKKLDLRGNPVPIPPEILGSKNLWENPGDVQEILNFYFQVQNPQETEPLYEAKFLIIGEGGAGKTSLAKKIENEAYKLQTDENSTQGIDVIQWQFIGSEGQKVRVNIWDFGGQEIYHHTHQFFLTERSLYGLVADTREENTDFFYWLKVVELLSDNSPVLIIKNEKQERQCQINERHLRSEFTKLKDILSTNLATDRGLSEIKKAIQYQISQLPHIGTPLPKLWVRIRSALENDSRNYISEEEYYRLCQINGLTNRPEMRQISRYLHDLGVCLHFQNDSLLKKTVILKPEWGTKAVYKVLVDNPTVQKNLGCFTQADLADIWKDIQYAQMRDELLQLMMRFKLCYEIPCRPQTYIAPQLLSANQPEYDWNDQQNLILRYEYEFMPKGILTRFIVEMHRLIEEQKQVWKHGVILNNNNRAKAEVIECYRYHKGEIKIRVSGFHKKELLSIINNKFDEIHQSFERLQYKTLIPCNCFKCKDNPDPENYPLDRLYKYLQDNRPTIECSSSYDRVNIRGLIDDVIEPIYRERDSFDSFPPSSNKRQQHININIGQENPTMSTNYLTHYGSGDNVGNVAGDKVTHNIYNNQEIQQTSQEINVLLSTISQNYEPNTPAGQMMIGAKAIEIVDQDPTLKKRVMGALKSAGEEALEQMIEHPAAKVFIAGAKGFIDP
ncbi:leucine-rich repeat domain-containing protein [Planktothrix paucivesiculata]|uniref:non-specific serine/threonine protein kinase n=1 Tax=Planktothrix paucivesiculata PCC 9631 TaxID=671071 RepID=A0A7Z9BVB4_9CYAN